MGVRFPSVASTTIANATIVTTAETVVVTTPPINLPVDSALVLLVWNINLTTGTGVATWLPKLRRGTTTGGTLVNNASVVASTASVGQNVAGCYIDSPGVVAEQQYCLTLTLASASGNSTVNDVCMMAFVL